MKNRIVFKWNTSENELGYCFSCRKKELITNNDGCLLLKPGCWRGILKEDEIHIKDINACHYIGIEYINTYLDRSIRRRIWKRELELRKKEERIFTAFAFNTEKELNNWINEIKNRKGREQMKKVVFGEKKEVPACANCCANFKPSCNQVGEDEIHVSDITDIDHIVYCYNTLIGIITKTPKNKFFLSIVLIMTLTNLHLKKTQ
jgi:hypothetical protein